MLLQEKYFNSFLMSDGSDGKAYARNAGDRDSIPGSGRSPGEGNGNPLQYSCLENSMGGGAWWAIVHGVAKSWTQLSDFSLHNVRYKEKEKICVKRLGFQPLFKENKCPLFF